MARGCARRGPARSPAQRPAPRGGGKGAGARGAVQTWPCGPFLASAHAPACAHLRASARFTGASARCGSVPRHGRSALLRARIAPAATALRHSELQSLQTLAEGVETRLVCARRALSGEKIPLARRPAPRGVQCIHVDHPVVMRTVRCPAHGAWSSSPPFPEASMRTRRSSMAPLRRARCRAFTSSTRTNSETGLSFDVPRVSLYTLLHCLRCSSQTRKLQVEQPFCSRSTHRARAQWRRDRFER